MVLNDVCVNTGNPEGIQMPINSTQILHTHNKQKYVDTYANYSNKSRFKVKWLKSAQLFVGEIDSLKIYQYIFKTKVNIQPAVNN